MTICHFLEETSNFSELLNCAKQLSGNDRAVMSGTCDMLSFADSIHSKILTMSSEKTKGAGASKKMRYSEEISTKEVGVVIGLQNIFVVY